MHCDLTRFCQPWIQLTVRRAYIDVPDNARTTCLLPHSISNVSDLVTSAGCQIHPPRFQDACGSHTQPVRVLPPAGCLCSLGQHREALDWTCNRQNDRFNSRQLICVRVEFVQFLQPSLVANSQESSTCVDTLKVTVPRRNFLKFFPFLVHR